jgi:hypothetical protein
MGRVIGARLKLLSERKTFAAIEICKRSKPAKIIPGIFESERRFLWMGSDDRSTVYLALWMKLAQLTLRRHGMGGHTWNGASDVGSIRTRRIYDLMNTSTLGRCDLFLVSHCWIYLLCIKCLISLYMHAITYGIYSNKLLSSNHKHPNPICVISTSISGG